MAAEGLKARTLEQAARILDSKHQLAERLRTARHD